MKTNHHLNLASQVTRPNYSTSDSYLWGYIKNRIFISPLPAKLLDLINGSHNTSSGVDKSSKHIPSKAGN